MADFLLEAWKAAALIAMALLAATPERAASADCRSSEGRTIEAIVVGSWSVRCPRHLVGTEVLNDNSRECGTKLDCKKPFGCVCLDLDWDWIAEELEIPAR